MDIIDETEGVETCDCFSRYRFRLGVGKAFDSKEVRKDVQDRVIAALKNKKED